MVGEVYISDRFVRLRHGSDAYYSYAGVYRVPVLDFVESDWNIAAEVLRETC